MIVKLLTEHHLQFLSLKGGCRGSSESTNINMPHCWKCHALAHIWIDNDYSFINSSDPPGTSTGSSLISTNRPIYD